MVHGPAKPLGKNWHDLERRVSLRRMFGTSIGPPTDRDRFHLRAGKRFRTSMEYRKIGFEAAMLLKCKHCPNTFEANRSYQKFCSAKCRLNAESERYRSIRAKRSREYGQKKFGWKPKPTKPIVCAAPNCENIFVPQTSWGRCCSVRCGNRLRYK